MMDREIDCPACGLPDHPHQTCAEANMTDDEIRAALAPQTTWDGARSTPEVTT